MKVLKCSVLYLLRHLSFSLMTWQGLIEGLLFLLCRASPDASSRTDSSPTLLSSHAAVTPIESRTLGLFPAFPGLLSPRGEETGQNSTSLYFLSFLTSLGSAEFEIIQTCCQVATIILSTFLRKHILNYLSAYTK